MKRTTIWNAACITLAATAIISIGCQKSSLLPEPNGSSQTVQQAPQNPAIFAKGGSQTCQSIMMQVTGQTEIVIVGNQVWKFDEMAAAIAYYGYNNCNAATSGPGNGNQCRNEALNAAKSAKCDLWAMEGHPGWVMTHENGVGETGATITLNTILAGESFMKGGQFNTNGKYSFTLKDDQNMSRITNLAYSIDGGSPIALNHAVVDGNSGANNCHLDLIYNANNGPYGNSAVFSYLKSGMTIQSILASDDTQSNDAGCPVVSIGVADPIVANLSTGTHTIVVSGTVKGNSGEANVNITTQSTIHISAESCE